MDRYFEYWVREFVDQQSYHEHCSELEELLSKLDDWRESLSVLPNGEKPGFSSLDSVLSWRKKTLSSSFKLIQNFEADQHPEVKPEDCSEIRLLFMRRVTYVDADFDPEDSDRYRFFLRGKAKSNGRYVWIFSDSFKEVLALEALDGDDKTVIEKIVHADDEEFANDPKYVTSSLDCYGSAVALLESLVDEGKDFAVSDRKRAADELWLLLEYVRRMTRDFQSMVIETIAREERDQIEANANTGRDFLIAFAVIGFTIGGLCALTTLK